MNCTAEALALGNNTRDDLTDAADALEHAVRILLTTNPASAVTLAWRMGIDVDDKSPMEAVESVRFRVAELVTMLRGEG